jgi:hypothetical protein
MRVGPGVSLIALVLIGYGHPTTIVGRVDGGGPGAGYTLGV